MFRKTVKTWKCFRPPRTLHHDTLLWSVYGRGAQNVFTGTSESCVQTRFRSKGSGKLLPCCPAKNNEALIAIKVVQRKHSLLWDDRMGPNYHENILVLQYLGTWLRVSGGPSLEKVCGKWGKIDYVRNKRPSISYCNLNLWWYLCSPGWLCAPAASPRTGWRPALPGRTRRCWGWAVYL